MKGQCNATLLFAFTDLFFLVKRLKKPCVISLAVWVCGFHTDCNVLFLFILKRLVVTWHAAAVCYMDSQS